jgi:hypothetical protein
MDDLAVAVLADEGGGVIGLDGQYPELEGFGDHCGDRLGESETIEQPIGSVLFGNMLHTVGVENLAGEGMAIPVFRAGKLPQVGFLRCFGMGLGLAPSFK